ncbi:MAG: Rdx family protein [Alphaproteobacteria bacterium]|nr:Rdx family protein [Alphaproteobacteria bacterium]
MEIAPGRTGSFEITRDGELLFSKLDQGRFPEDDEVRGLASGG